MIGLITTFTTLAAEWMRIIGKASAEGALALLIAWLLCALLPGVTGNVRCWVWRLAFLKLVVALLLWQPIEIPLFKPKPEPAAAGTAGAQFRQPATRALPALASREPSRRSTAVPLSAGGSGLGIEARPVQYGGATWVLIAWMLGVGVSGALLAVQRRAIGRWRRRCTAGDDPRLVALFGEMCRELHVARPPVILVHELHGPLLLGGRTPAIILPSELVRTASDDELRMVLAHELAHVKRHDFFWSSVVVLAQTLFFFHPLVWLGRRQYRLAQEMACDELTVRTTAVSTREYAELLLKVATGHGAKGWSSGALGVLGSGTALDRRLTLLQQLGTRTKRQTVWAGTVAALIALGGLAPWRVVAQTTTTSPGKATTEGALRPAIAAKGTADAGTPWEEMLLLQATRYLRLSPAQLQQLLPAARTASRQLSDLQLREDKVLESLRRIALRQRDALAAGRASSTQEQADAITMRENALRARAESERAIVNGALGELVKLLAPKQVERAFLLQQGLTPEGEAREPALLDPAAGFVSGAFGPGSTFGFESRGRSVSGPRQLDMAGNQPSLAERLLQAQSQLSMFQRDLAEPLPPGSVGGAVFVRQNADGKPPMVFRFNTSPDAPTPPLPPGVTGPEVMDAAAFRQHLAEETQALSKEVASLRHQLFSPEGTVSPDQYQALLRPLARRLFLSPRFQQAVENRLHVKD